MSSRHVPFQALRLSDDERQHCQDRSFQLLDRTLRSYDERDGQGDEGRRAAPLHHSNLENTRWKLLKTQADASIYTARHKCALDDHNLLGGDWKDPVVILTAGTIRGDLDEIMLGIEMPDVTSFRMRTELFTKQPVDCAILAELLGPTQEDPFQYLGIQWMVYEHVWPLKTMVRPRDFVSLAATGTMMRANGDRIGYEVTQPARLPQCPPLPGAVLRGKVMYAAIFKQQEPGVVDVFIHTYVESQGAILDKLIVSVTLKGNLGFWGADKLAEMKKLQWCIANRSSRQFKQQQQRASGSTLGVCKHCFGRHAVMKQCSDLDQDDKNCCVLCASTTCWPCRVERKIKVLDDDSARLTDQVVVVCPPCLIFDSATISETVFEVPSDTTSTPSPPVASSGLTCGSQLKNIYYHGFNLQTSAVSDAAACCELCTAYDGCVLYTYFHSSSTGQSLCYLKSGAGEKTNYADSSSVTTVSAFMVSATSAPAPATTSTPSPSTATPSACNELLEGVFFDDYTIYEFSTDSADECCAYCAQLADEGCVLYTLYVSKSEGVKRCLLKSAAGTSTNYTTSDDLTVVSAFLPASATPTPTPAAECSVAEGEYCGNAQGTTCCESDSYCQPWNTYYYHSALTLYPWLCCSLCQQTEGCNAYTFVNLDPAGPTCYMKTSTAGRVRSVGALSGVPLTKTTAS
ncbi:hypothetical protein PHYSODRAFT_485841 [Phytophthora sojae]|uniref:Apple domain-containing protein n=1 Tax=Phytophthora sojae (strain P6497) TaxID=1094619 RepID=G4YTG2_PHYSP|nr:hypothetical protein PHYSODRAFT_485841 [Phytophthora sojae]EGZ23561.1 hypothetical protein PHYSODRAFT_485841 [Phytophthora sojae]|eukprot:XP_009518849.1 hypothetical protein PHYSODRAFT_485841 [Phytophthora sojae]